MHRYQSPSCAASSGPIFARHSPSLCMGAWQVFKAQWNGAEAAVKILHDQGEKQKADFLHEATILKGLRHPNVVDYFGLAFSDKDEVRACTALPSLPNRARPHLSYHKATLCSSNCSIDANNIRLDAADACQMTV